MLNSFLWLSGGLIVGLLASRLVQPDGRQATLIDMAVGGISAFFAGLILTQLFGFATVNDDQLNIASLIVAAVAAALSVAVVKFLRRGAIQAT